MSQKYKRILLKLSGEALAGKQKQGLNPDVVFEVANELKSVHETGIQLGLVIGGGNIFRGLSASAKGMDRTSSDYMGMLATMINSLALQDALEKLGVQTRVQSAITMVRVAEPYIRRKAVRHLEKGRIVIFGAGTGNPYFSTDTTAALRATEISADCLIKGTKVDGVYDKDPMLHKDAKLYETLSYIDVLNKGLRSMDLTAVSLCMENQMPIITLNLTQPGNILRFIQGEKIGTIIN